MTTLEEAAALARHDRGLVVISTLRSNGTIQASLESPRVCGRAPRVLHSRDIAEQVASLYWPQVIPYPLPGAASAEVLRQITLPRAAIVAAVSSFRSAAQEAGATSWQLGRLRLPAAYKAMLDQVEVTVAEQPLPRLQAAGSAQAVFPFLYELSWGPRESFSVARLRRHGPRGPAIDLLPGAGDELLRLGPLIRPLIETALDQDGRRNQRRGQR